MLDAICQMIRGFARVDDGVECVLNKEAYRGFIELIRNVYGNHAADVMGDQWTLSDGRYTCPMEDTEEAFLLCLTGKG